MATTPQPPRPPLPPPPRSGSTVLAIVLLVIGFLVVVSFVVVAATVRFFSRNVQLHVNEGASGKKEVSIQTPVGSIEVNKKVDAVGLGLPIYPGATRVEDRDSASVNIGLPDEQNVRILVVRFETSDPADTVRKYYRDHLGGQVTSYVEKDLEGRTVLKIKTQHEEKAVVIKQQFLGDKTRIELVRVVRGEGTTN